ncbi:hypothetical protein [Deminuibacter soli]|uniref:Uncharacterized protein n=1 Tax=Deminuibacter soli TaxID=2291815 RepID=A0A3E1NIV5_9BACT|nr:hypothetical protein [Deminuibacter soli]RFM27876.1 hypothetical protein DXN05_14380 [Deminuibacter soli]
MKARISNKGRALLKTPGAVYAMLDAINDKQDAFLHGEVISFLVPATSAQGAAAKPKTMMVRLSSAVDNQK